MKWGDLKVLIDSTEGVTDETEVEFIELGTPDPNGPDVYYDPEDDSIAVH